MKKCSTIAPGFIFPDSCCLWRLLLLLCYQQYSTVQYTLTMAVIIHILLLAWFGTELSDCSDGGVSIIARSPACCSGFQLSGSFRTLWMFSTLKSSSDNCLHDLCPFGWAIVASPPGKRDISRLYSET